MLSTISIGYPHWTIALVPQLTKLRFLLVLTDFGIQQEAKSDLYFLCCVYKCVKDQWKNQAQNLLEIGVKKKFKYFYKVLW
ncbi:hypothetical protein C7460_101432 [Marinoscillum furvescens DSM 4134]|uniref:Uncharacterized protein n=1 Tax=Marinoscillum furvescens DSM 4134 TaxID=1122208 RepID=A0A3D9LJC7_MARFU|nr:hypothetical protein C7460_101432 [Marinoscillum furvescens DSM 4134]